MHHCFNVVCGPEGRAAAVLVRALEPVLGLDVMRRRRPGVPAARLARGPGSLARALGLDRRHDGADLTRGRLWIADLAPRRGGHPIGRGPRVGISRAAERPWRYWLVGSAAVSAGPRRASAVDTPATHS
jgi:DNA-3-methyladenine glycosylase